MQKPLIIRPTEEVVRYVALNMREDDKQEVSAASGMDPLRALEFGVSASSGYCYAALDPKGWPAVVFGVVEMPFGGAPWLLGTDSIARYARRFHKEAVAIVDRMLTDWGTLYNLVDARNTVHVKWLRRLGFSFGAPVIHGVEQRPFLPFSRIMNDV
jgi:hypothetical protein